MPRRRERTAARRTPTLEPRLRLLVVCGSERTETDYFKGLRSRFDFRSVDIKILERSRSPDQVVEYARDHCGYRDFDETWCVVDVDSFETEGKKITAAGLAARAAEIRLAVSNPCFEYWLLLHHVDSGTPFSRCNEVVSRLRRYVVSYDKTKLRLADFADGVGPAVERARKREPSGADYLVNPSSGVWMLVERFREER